jgi:hypothetical protein
MLADTIKTKDFRLKNTLHPGGAPVRKKASPLPRPTGRQSADPGIKLCPPGGRHHLALALHGEAERPPTLLLPLACTTLY